MKTTRPLPHKPEDFMGHQSWPTPQPPHVPSRIKKGVPTNNRPKKGGSK